MRKQKQSKWQHLLDGKWKMCTDQTKTVVLGRSPTIEYRDTTII